MASQQPPQPSGGGPYAPMIALLGGVPTTNVDVPITAVFLALFICGAATHMTILQKNNKRGHKFIISGVLFGFCMARIVTCIMRIAWACRPTNVRIAIAAQIFVAAGVVLLFVINAFFAQRIVRSVHPHIGWSRGFKALMPGVIGLIVVSLFLLIGMTVTSFYTLNPNLRRVARDIQLYGQSAFLAIAFLPFPLLLVTALTTRRSDPDHFGKGSLRTKMSVVFVAAVLLCLGAAFRLGTSAKNPRPRNQPAWFDHKACFYIFNFTLEILVILTFAVVRVDQRFHVPNGASGAGSYSASGKATKDEVTSTETEEEKVTL